MKTSHPWHNGFLETIKRLYRTFSSYKAEPSSIGVCPHCIHQGDLDALFAKPLRELDAATINVFASVAVGTHGRVTDLKHFLPRICELIPDVLCETDPLEIYISTLRHAEWLAWPEKEVLAVRSFLLEWWRWTLADFPSVAPVDNVIGAIAQAEDDLLPYLDEWDLQCRSDWPALRQLVDFYHAELIRTGRQDRLSIGVWWEARPQQDSQMCRWLLQYSTREHFARAKHEYGAKWGVANEIDLILVHHDVWHCKLPS